MATLAAQERRQAFKELRDGQKKGHWIWWIFPSLREWGGDMNSALQMPGGADMANCSEAWQYLAVPDLRDAYLRALKFADAAMAPHSQQAPFHLFDEGFGRAPIGSWVQGPVDSFKARASFTLFASVASQQQDLEMVAGCLQALQHFKGDCIYTPGGPGTAGYTGAKNPPIVLKGPDPQVLQKCRVDWATVVASQAIS